jgi:hypothetical protein
MTQEKDYTIIALAQCLINTWKQYQKYEEQLSIEMNKRGFKEEYLWDAKSFISDIVIGDECVDGVEFEDKLQDKLKENITDE